MEPTDILKAAVVLPGDDVTSIIEGFNSSNDVMVGSGLYIAPRKDHRSNFQQSQDYALHKNPFTRILASNIGLLRSQKSYSWIESNKRFYEPLIGDQVIGIIEDRGADFYRVNIFSSSSAILNRLSFDGATKRNRPELKKGDVVFCLIQSCERDQDTEITCIVKSGTRKDWSSGDSIFGELSDGILIQLNQHYANTLRLPNNAILNSIGKVIPFEIAVGMNGVIWLKASTCRQLIIIRNLIIKGENLDKAEIEACIARLVKEEANQVSS